MLNTLAYHLQRPVNSSCAFGGREDIKDMEADMKMANIID
jgi:hypothetical protein